MTVTPGPVADLTASATGGIICGGLDAFNQPYADTVTFTANILPGATYRFYNGAVPLTPIQASHIFATDNFSIYDTDLEFDISS